MTLVVSTSSSVALSLIRTSIALGAESDLAVNRPVTLYSGAVGGTVPQSAVDGNDSTFVQFGDDGVRNGWAYVDIGVGVSVSSVRVLFDGRVPAGCPGLGPVIESGMSPDAFTTRWTSPNAVVFDTGLVTVPVESAGDRLWRVLYTLPAGSMSFPGCRLFLASFSVFGHYTPPVPPSGVGPDLARGRPVTLYSAFVGGTMPESAVDGNDSTFVQFGDDGVSNGWAYVDVGVGVSVSSVRVLFDGRVPAGCPGLGPVIQSGMSPDAFTTRWTPSATIVVDTGLVTVLPAAAGDRLWRVLYTLPAGSMGFPGCRLFLASFSVFSVGGPNTPPAGNAPPTANAGGPYSVPEGGSTTLSGSGSDPDGDPLSYSWDLVGDRTFGPPGQNVTYSAAGRDGPSSYPVSLRVCDSKGACATSNATVNVTNLPPSISSVTNNGPASEGSRAMINVAASDPAGALDPLWYSFDCNNDGTYEVGPQSSNSASCTFADNGSHPVGVRVTDGDGGLATGRTLVGVLNVPPVVMAGGNVTFTEEDLEGDDDDDEGLLFTRAGSFTDPGADTWTATVDWGDGCGPQPLTLTGKTFVLSRRFSDDDNPCRHGDDDKDKHDKDKHDKDKHDKHHKDKHDKDKHHKDDDVRVFTVSVTVRDDDGGVGMATFRVTLIDD